MRCSLASVLLSLLLFESGECFQCLTTTSFPGFKFSTALWGKKVKRGGLGSIAEGGVLSTPKKLQKSASTAPKKKRSAGGGVSSDLASWATSQQTSEPSSVQDEKAETFDDVMEDVEASFVPFEKEKKGQSKRRMKQTERLQLDENKNAIVNSIVEKLENTLEGNNNIDAILDVISTFFDQDGTSIKTLTSGKQRLNYRLAWVGSDDALCHIGTGLHRVPLARMQEVFMNFQGKGRIEIYEVISVIGPFPNVRNTLQGGTEASVGETFTDWTIVMDSMIDGTGKEILAGKDENIRRVSLDVHFSDQNAVVAVVPKTEERPRKNPLEDNGKNVLVFVREDALDEKLDALRVL